MKTKANKQYTHNALFHKLMQHFLQQQLVLCRCEKLSLLCSAQEVRDCQRQAKAKSPFFVLLSQAIRSTMVSLRCGGLKRCYQCSNVFSKRQDRSCHKNVIETLFNKHLMKSSSKSKQSFATSSTTGQSDKRNRWISKSYNKENI